MAKFSIPRRDIGLLLLLSTILASQFIFIKLATDNFSPAAVTTYRILISMMFIAALTLTTRKLSLQKMQKILPKCLWLAFLGEILAPYLIAYGEQHTNASMAATVTATAPFFTIVIAHFALKREKIKKHSLIACGLGLAGILVLYRNQLVAPPEELKAYAGLAGAALCLGLVNIIGRTLAKTDPRIASLVTFMAAGAITGPVAASGPVLAEWRTAAPLAIFAIFGLGIVVNGIGTILFLRLAKNTNAVTVSYVGYLIPMFATIAAWILLGEPFSMDQVAALVLILTGLSFIKPKRQR